MDREARLEAVRAMNTVALMLNDEEVFEEWLEYGVADGDISDDPTQDDDLDYYIEDENFADLLGTFAHMMKVATRGTFGWRGALTCDGIIYRG